MSLAAVVRSTRPPFLILAPVCVLLGVAVVHVRGLPIDPLALALALLGGLAAHISVNTFNEYFDFHSGLDFLTRKTPFSGGSGALPDVPEAHRQVLATAIGSLLLTVAIGVFFSWQDRLWIVPVGLAGLALVYFYTRWINRIPWLCLIAPGLGFGILMVLGTEIALSGHWSRLGLLSAALPFLLVNNLLLLNQYPDLDADKQVGRRHFAIVYGLDRANIAYLVSVLLAAGLLLWGSYRELLPTTSLLALLPLPLAAFAWTGARRYGTRLGEHPQYLAANVVVSLLSPALLALGLLL
jgi:1,4-dihydroxy-2-naphthoate polyprenyltransferase